MSTRENKRLIARAPLLKSNEFKGRHEFYITLIPDSDIEVKVTHLFFQ